MVATGEALATLTNGYGLYVGNSFTHNGSGVITATSKHYGASNDAGRAYGLYVRNGFTNSGSGLVNLLAYSQGSGHSYGLFVYTGGLTTSGRITLAAQGANTAFSAYLDNQANNHATFQSGSTLYLADTGANLSFALGGQPQSAYIGSGAKLISLAATVAPSASPITHSKLINRADGFFDGNNTVVGASGTNGFVTADNGVLRYTHIVLQGTGNSDGTYGVTVERLADASAVTGGAAGAMVGQLENYWRGTVLFDGANNINNLDTPDIGWLYLLAGIENAPNVAAAARSAYLQTTPMGVNQAVLGLNQAGRTATSQFKYELLGSLPVLYDRGFAYPQAAPSGGDVSGDRTSLWARPFYHTGTRDGYGGFADQDQDFTGLNMGLTRFNTTDWGDLAFGAAFNYVDGDFDGGQYSADSDSYGFSLGLTARFAGGENWNPRAALYGGYLHHSLKQTRRIGSLPHNVGAGSYYSEPDGSTWNLGLSLDNDFHLTPDTILRPRLGLDYARTSLDGFAENGPAQGLPLTVAETTYDSLRSDLGASLIWQAAPGLNLELRADYYHEFQDTEAAVLGRASTAPGLIFTAAGLDPGRDSGSAGTGLSWTPASVDNVTLSLDYDYHFGAGYSGHEVAGLFRLDF